MIPIVDLSQLGTLIYWVALVVVWAFGFNSGHSR